MLDANRFELGRAGCELEVAAVSVVTAFDEPVSAALRSALGAASSGVWVMVAAVVARVGEVGVTDNPRLDVGRLSAAAGRGRALTTDIPIGAAVVTTRSTTGAAVLMTWTTGAAVRATDCTTGAVACVTVFRTGATELVAVFRTGATESVAVFTTGAAVVSTASTTGAATLATVSVVACVTAATDSVTAGTGSLIVAVGVGEPDCC